MTKPLFSLADDLALAEILGGFAEAAQHRTYGAYGWVGGSRLNRRTHDALKVAAHLSGWGPIAITQGGLNGGAVAASAATHNGLDVADTQTRGRSTKDILALVEAGMKCGAIGFIRGTGADAISDGMVPHIHWVMVGAQHAHPSARDQLYHGTYGYFHGGAGLAGMPSARWYGPRRAPEVQWADSRYNPKNGWRP